MAASIGCKTLVLSIKIDRSLAQKWDRQSMNSLAHQNHAESEDLPSPIRRRRIK